MKRVVTFCNVVLFVLCFGKTVQSQTLTLPINGDTVVGELKLVSISVDDTFADIARKYDMGYNDLIAANSHVDPWTPRENQLLVIPSLYILPPKPWQGVIINIPEMRLYYFPNDKALAGKVITYPVGVGKENWATPAGEYFVTMKIKDPSWTIPESVLKEEKYRDYTGPRVVPPGDDNPLGKFALLLNEPTYLIHGTNKPYGIGRRVSHGCIRLYPEDVESLFKMIPRDTPVRIIDKPFKIGKKGNTLYLEAHRPFEESIAQGINLSYVNSEVVTLTHDKLRDTDWRLFEYLTDTYSGIPTAFTEIKPSGSHANVAAVKNLNVYPKKNSLGTTVLENMLEKMGVPFSKTRCSTQACYKMGPLANQAQRKMLREIFKNNATFTQQFALTK